MAFLMKHFPYTILLFSLHYLYCEIVFLIALWSIGYGRRFSSESSRVPFPAGHLTFAVTVCQIDVIG